MTRALAERFERRRGGGTRTLAEGFELRRGGALGFWQRGLNTDGGLGGLEHWQRYVFKRGRGRVGG